MIGGQKEFKCDLVDLFVVCSVPWNVANNPQTHNFAEKWLPEDVVIPDRHVLSGCVLNSQVKKVKDQICKKVTRKLATGQCDGWKNIAKTSVVAMVMSVENEVWVVYLIYLSSTYSRHSLTLFAHMT